VSHILDMMLKLFITLATTRYRIIIGSYRFHFKYGGNLKRKLVWHTFARQQEADC
jgi:hypothetical protein